MLDVRLWGHDGIDWYGNWEVQVYIVTDWNSGIPQSILHVLRYVLSAHRTRYHYLQYTVLVLITVIYHGIQSILHRLSTCVDKFNVYNNYKNNDSINVLLYIN